MEQELCLFPSMGRNEVTPVQYHERQDACYWVKGWTLGGGNKGQPGEEEAQLEALFLLSNTVNIFNNLKCTCLCVLVNRKSYIKIYQVKVLSSNFLAYIDLISYFLKVKNKI